ncbi:MAG: family penicillin-binding protein [Patescibacteria group bacterium]|nr:family penicillin-binding protein [Patescibacteria group bacterium]
MAKSKKHKRKPTRRSAFYESVPATLTPPATVPDMREHLYESTLTLAELGQRFINHLQTIQWSRIRHFDPDQRQAILAVGQRSLTISRKVLAYTAIQSRRASLNATRYLLRTSRLAWGAAQSGAQTARTFAPPIAADLRAYTHRGGRTLSSRRARALYLAVAAAGSLAIITIAVSTAASTMSSYANDISSPAALLAKKKTGTTILDRNGQVLYEGYGGQATNVVPLKQLPQQLKDATLAAEDPDFYAHPGFSWRGTARAAWVDITHRSRVEGGSTLTQQLVKNALLTSHKNLQRKYQELLLSMELERHYSKDQILEMYLNEVYYGQGSSGIAAASQTYFHKAPRDLSLGESALIAGLPLGPNRFDPNADLGAATGRRDYVLSRMLELGKITKTQAEAAKNQPLQLAAGATVSAPNPMTVYAKSLNIQAPHFVFYVLNQLRQQYGTEAVEEGGITVQTTLDLSKQHLAEQTVAEHVNALAEHHVTNGGLISLEPTSGDILAMVGSVDYNAPGFGNVNVIMSELQPGSSFKPIAYATAFKKGWNGATHVDDTPLVLPNGDGSQYIPQNYDLKFHGSVSLRHALDNSLNIPAIKVLQYAGIHDTIQTAHDLGITTLQDENRFGLALVLGGGEVRPIDMATAYATFANNGTKVPPRAIAKVSDRYGKDITKSGAKAQAALDPRVAYMITNILSDNNSRAPEFPLNSPLLLSRPSAAKTGTTNDFRDNWTVGYTPQLVTAVWVGNNDHSAMNNIDGITGAAPIWHDYMEGALASLPVANFTPPAGVATAKVCSGGGLANPWDAATDEVFFAGALPTARCNSNPAAIKLWNLTLPGSATPVPLDASGQPIPPQVPADANPFRFKFQPNN